MCGSCGEIAGIRGAGEKTRRPRQITVRKVCGKFGELRGARVGYGFYQVRCGDWWANCGEAWGWFGNSQADADNCGEFARKLRGGVRRPTSVWVLSSWMWGSFGETAGRRGAVSKTRRPLPVTVGKLRANRREVFGVHIAYGFYKVRFGRVGADFGVVRGWPKIRVFSAKQIH